MTRTALPDLPAAPKLAENVAHFARALRAAGLPIGPGRVVEAVRAVQAAGFTERADFRAALAACLVSRPEERVIFDQVFRLFWRDPRFVEHMMAMLLPSIRGTQEDRPAKPAERRAAEALVDGTSRPPPEPDEAEAEQIEIDAAESASANEVLRALDFEQMSAAEMARARRLIAQLRLPVPPVPARRAAPAPRGRPDRRAALRAALRRGGDLGTIPRAAPRPRWPVLVVLCDISGSMAAYSRALLHFAHALARRPGQGWARVEAFTFGTRLTNISRHLRGSDVDAALAAIGQEAPDWEGGTRIGESLHAFNRDWARRVLGQGAVVLLVTDGLERGDPALLAREAERLHLMARQVIWLNPLLRFDGFAPRAGGVAALMPHVDMFRAGHNIAALEGLAGALAGGGGDERARMLALMRAGQGA